MNVEFISIGPYCVTKCNLKKTNNALMSYPFDSIFSSLQIFLHCMEDKFETFLNKDFITGLNERQSSHKIYDNQLPKLIYYSNPPIVFNHNNLLIDREYEKYQRRCERFLDAINDKSRLIYLVYTIKNNEVNVEYNLNDLVYTANQLPHCNFVVIYVTDNIGTIHINNLRIYKILDDDETTLNNIFDSLKNI